MSDKPTCDYYHKGNGLNMVDHTCTHVCDYKCIAYWGPINDPKGVLNCAECKKDVKPYIPFWLFPMLPEDESTWIETSMHLCRNSVIVNGTIYCRYTGICVCKQDNEREWIEYVCNLNKEVL